MTSAEDARKELGRFLRGARQEAGATQLELATHLGYSTGQFVSNWERGESMPPRTRLPGLAAYLGIEPKEMVDAIMQYEEACAQSTRAELSEILERAQKRRAGARVR